MLICYLIEASLTMGLIAPIIELDLTVMRRDDLNIHIAGLTGLRRNNRPHEQITVTVVIIGDACSQGIKLGEGERFAFAGRHQGMQGLGIEGGIARNFNVFHRKGGSCQQVSHALPLNGKDGCVGWQGWSWRLDLLQERACAGNDGICRLYGQGGKRHRHGEQQRFHGGVHNRSPWVLFVSVRLVASLIISGANEQGGQSYSTIPNRQLEVGRFPSVSVHDINDDIVYLIIKILPSLMACAG
uniref:Uncharacterized protein n=1 Tax=mine drainage metagenome TaxID=410659 RepID=E6QQ94_9ZZZZ